MGDIGTPFGGDVPMLDPLVQFLGRVLAWSADSFVNFHGFTPKAQAGREYARRGGGRAFTSLMQYAEIQQYLYVLDRAGDEAFFCISTRSAHKGTDARGRLKATRDKSLNRPVQLKAFVLDLDVKPRGYPSQKAALQAVLPFLEGLGIDFGPIVDTGVGLHVYITLPEGIAPAVWQPLANALVAAAQQAGIKLDVAVTKDDDRILRVPGSWNRKDPANPKLCRILGLGKDTPLDVLRKALAGYSGIQNSPTPKNGNGKIDLSFLPPRPPITRGPEFERVSAERERLRVVTSVDLLLEACPVVVDSDWRRGNGDREPLWFELAKLCHYVENGRDFFHDLSDGDDRYDEQATDDKFDSVQTEGWPYCSTIAAASDEANAICRRCPHYGEGKSPIHFATRGDPPGEAHSGQVNGHVNGTTLSAAPFVTAGGPPLRPIWLPEPYKYSDHFILTPDDRKVFHTPVLNIAVTYDTNGAMTYEFTTLKGTAETFDENTFAIPGSATGNPSRFNEAAHGYGLLPNRHVYKDFDFMTDLQTQIRQNKLAITKERTGWIGDTHHFALGGTTYTPNGPVPGARSDSPYLVPRGTLDAWKPAANFFMGKGLIEMEIIMACGYTGPLVCMTNAPGVFLYVWSGNSGRGKSAAMDCANSVSCHRLAVSRTSTRKAATDRVSHFNNIPAHFDELVPDDPRQFREFAQMIKTIVSGQGTNRLSRSSKEIPILSSRNQVVGCGNKRLTEASRTPDTNAQAARIVEFEMPDRLSQTNIHESDLIPVRHALEQNHGVAMPVFIDFVCRNYDQVEKILIDTIAYLERSLQSKPPQRFWICQIALIMVAARIARKLDLQQFDVPAIDRFLAGWFQEHRAEVFDPEALSDDPDFQLQKIRDFYNDNVGKVIITDHMPTRSVAKTPAKNGELLMNVKEFPIRIAVVDKLIRFSEAKLKAWFNLRGSSFDHTLLVLTRNGYCTRHRKGKSIGGGTNKYETAQEPLLEFNTADPRISGFVGGES